MGSLRTRLVNNSLLLLDTKHKEATKPREGQIRPRARFHRGLGGWDDERREGRRRDGVVEVEMDGEGDVSDGRGVESGCGAGAAVGGPWSGG